MIACRTLARLLVVIAAAQAPWAGAVEVRFERVADDVYAHVGDIGARTGANEGLNANLGLVVTPAGAGLIDSGATFRSARDIHAAIRRVTAQPVRWVINTGSQTTGGSATATSNPRAPSSFPTLRRCLTCARAAAINWPR